VLNLWLSEIIVARISPAFFRVRDDCRRMSVEAPGRTGRVVEIARDVRDAIAQVVGDRGAFSDRTAHHELRGRLLALVLITFILDALAAILMIWLGNHSFRRSAVWSTSLLVTGGAALDTGGQRHYRLALALELWAVTAVGAIAGSFGAFFHRLYLERDRSTASAKNG
jgi:hypothetical protein